MEDRTFTPIFENFHTHFDFSTALNCPDFRA